MVPRVCNHALVGSHRVIVAVVCGVCIVVDGYENQDQQKVNY